MIVFVHGNPETAAIWDPLIAALCGPRESSNERTMQFRREDVVALSPPGFGAPTPAGWAATSDDYLAWLIGEVEQLDGPIDLVGHDWGGGHVQRLAATRPDLVRTADALAGCQHFGVHLLLPGPRLPVEVPVGGGDAAVGVEDHGQPLLVDPGPEGVEVGIGR